MTEIYIYIYIYREREREREREKDWESEEWIKGEMERENLRKMEEYWEREREREREYVCVREKRDREICKRWNKKDTQEI